MHTNLIFAWDFAHNIDRADIHTSNWQYDQWLTWLRLLRALWQVVASTTNLPSVSSSFPGPWLTLLLHSNYWFQLFSFAWGPLSATSALVYQVVSFLPAPIQGSQPLETLPFLTQDISTSLSPSLFPYHPVLLVSVFLHLFFCGTIWSDQ